MLRSLYSSLLDLSVLQADGRPLADYIAERYALHASLVEAIAGRDKGQALHLITEHNTTDRLRPRRPCSAQAGAGRSERQITWAVTGSALPVALWHFLRVSAEIPLNWKDRLSLCLRRRL